LLTKSIFDFYLPGKLSIPSPPLPHSLLNSRIPVTIWVNSINCRSLSRLDKLRKLPNSV
jgi:hypothetical protein